jgi:valyl-tRNA synthetase
MYKDGLIYRDNYIVNYCTHCGTSFSELEVEYKDRIDPLVYMKYGPFVLATVRPETKFGDTAVAVNPNDSRYKEWIGKEIEFEGLIGPVKLKVIADDFVDPEFGTGVVKVTPAHDPNDFAMGRRHGLEVRQVIGFNGRLNERTGAYAGMKVNDARKKVIAKISAFVSSDKDRTHLRGTTSV